MGFAIPIDKWLRDKKFQRKISEIFYESEWTKLGYDKKKLIKSGKNTKNLNLSLRSVFGCMLLQEYGLTKIKKMEIRQGIDLLKIKRIEKIYKKYEHKFLKNFSDKEIEQINNSKVEKVKKIAGKISSKEAASKALGTGISNGIAFKDFEILNERNGCPKLKFYGVANTKLTNLSSSSISITHDGEYIVSVVTLLLYNK